MKLKALCKIYHDSDIYKVGEEFTVDKKTADDLILKGAAVTLELPNAKKSKDAEDAKKGK